MSNDRLRRAMAKAGQSVDAIAARTGVDPKTVQRWVAGRVPHARHRFSVAELLGEEEDFLWPVAPGRDAGVAADTTSEVKAAFAHRADVPLTLWRGLLEGARHHIALLGYAMLFFPEQHPSLVELLRRKGEDGCRIRVALAKPEAPQTMERDRLERLEGTLPDRIRTTMNHFRRAEEGPGFELRLHDVHLYNAIYRFDDDMIVTPYLYGARGYQHPALQLRRLSTSGLFEQYVLQFETIWKTAVPNDALAREPDQEGNVWAASTTTTSRTRLGQTRSSPEHLPS